MKANKKSILLVGLGLLTPVVLVSTISCKSFDQVLNETIEQGIQLQATEDSKKVTPNFIVDKIRELQSQGVASEKIKEFLEKFLTNWPIENKYTSIMPSKVEISSEDEKAILLTLKYSAGKEEKFVTVSLPFFRSETELNETILKNAIEQNWNLIKNEETMSSISATEAIKNINENNVSYKEYFSGIPEKVLGSNIEWTISDQSEYYQTGEVNVDTNSLVFELISETEIAVLAKYTYQKQEMTKKIIVSGFATNESVDLKTINDTISNYNQYNPNSLNVNANGEKILVGNVTIENIKNYVDNLPPETYSNGVKTEINKIEKYSEIGVNVYIKFYKNNSEKIITKIAVGFLSEQESSKNDLEYLVQNTNPSITLEGTKVLASTVNKDNLNLYVQGIPSLESVTTVINSISVDSQNETVLILEIYYKKDIFSSEIITKKVNGFKSISIQNFEDVTNIYNQYKDVSLEITEAGKEIVSNVVNKENINTYVSGLPTNIPNEVTLEIEDIIYGNGEINLFFYFTKNDQVSKQITKSVKGFRQIEYQDKFDVESVINSNFTLAVNAEGRTMSTNQVNKENVKNFVSGWPAEINGVVVSVEKVEPKTTDITNTQDFSTLIIELGFKKGTYSINMIYEVFGFKTPTETEIFEYNASFLEFFVTEMGKNITGYNITNENINEAIFASIKDSSININNFQLTYQTWSVVEGSDDTSLNVDILVKQGIFQKTIKKQISGFKSRTTQSQENFSLAFNNYVNLVVKSNDSIQNVLAYDIYNNWNLVNEYFQIPESIRDVSVELVDVMYVGTNNALSFSTIIFRWKITNTWINNVQYVNNQLSNLKNPYDRYFALNGNSFTSIARRENSNGVYNNIEVDSEGHIKSTWQSTWAQWGYTSILLGFKNERTDPFLYHDYLKALEGFALAAINEYNNDSNVDVQYIVGIPLNDEWDKSGENGMSGWVVWLNNSINYKITYKGYPSINIIATLKLGTRNGYWK